MMAMVRHATTMTMMTMTTMTAMATAQRKGDDPGGWLGGPIFPPCYFSFFSRDWPPENLPHAKIGTRMKTMMRSIGQHVNVFCVGLQTNLMKYPHI